MEHATEQDIEPLARRLKLSLPQVQAAVELLENGLEIPFIARYCRQQTQGLNAEPLHAIRDAWQQRQSLQERKEQMLLALRERDQLTPEIEQRIRDTRSPKRLEDIYLPYKRKKHARTGQGRMCDLEPFVDRLLDGALDEAAYEQQLNSLVGDEGGFASVDDVRSVVHVLLIERFCEHIEARQRLRTLLKKSGAIVAKRMHSPPEREDEVTAHTGVAEAPDGGRSDTASEPPHDHSHGQAVSSDSVSTDGAETRGGITDNAEIASATTDSGTTDSGTTDSGGTDSGGTDSGGTDSTETESTETESAETESAETESAETVDTVTDRSVVDVAARPGEDAAGSDTTDGNLASAEDEDADARAVEQSDRSPLAASNTAAETTAASTGTTDLPAADTAPSDVSATAVPAGPAVTGAHAQARLSAKSKSSSAAEERRRKRRESRHRRRALLEASFREFFAFRQPLSRVSTRQLLALARGERVRALEVSLEVPEDQAVGECLSLLVPADHPATHAMQPAAREAVIKQLLPDLQREVRNDFTVRAEQEAATWFCEQLSEWLLQQPLACRVLAVDPGLRYGCKVAALDEAGRLLAHAYMHATGDANHIEQARRALCEMLRHHRLQVVAIGNGPGHRDAEKLVLSAMQELKDPQLGYAIVNQAGAHTYAKSSTANQELPEFDTRLRVAISIGRRLQDPLAELIKISPCEIGIGPFRHDVKFKHLSPLLTQAVAECVAKVGAHLNAATPSLLSYVPGIDEQAAAAIFNHREKYGGYGSLGELREHGLLTPEAFQQAAGFLMIPNGANPLDGTLIHPENHDLATQVLERAGLTLDHLRHQIQNSVVDHKTVTVATLHEEPVTPSPAPAEVTGTDAVPVPETSETRDWHARWHAFDLEAAASELQLDPHKLRDIVRKLDAVGKDPRDGYHAPLIRHHALRLEDLQPGSELTGIVVNVAPFGAFVDVGLPESGLIHISRLANRFVSDPHDVYCEGDVVRVWVVEVDQQRRRVALTAIAPGTAPPRPPQRGRPAHSGQRRYRSQQQREHRKAAGDSRAPKTHTPPRRRKPRRVVPITDAMKKGAEPMRTFSDLKQFYEHRQTDEPPPPANDK